ncbi:hypothetical protein AX17_000546 [Amanita inopinata Kibby_2008]|nr:hypothetical protein AX17_000546 [Amanita inopinata Kibby_2008]
MTFFRNASNFNLNDVKFTVISGDLINIVTTSNVTNQDSLNTTTTTNVNSNDETAQSVDTGNIDNNANATTSS